LEYQINFDITTSQISLRTTQHLSIAKKSPNHLESCDFSGLKNNQKSPYHLINHIVVSLN